MLDGVFGSGESRHVASWNAVKVIDRSEEVEDNGTITKREREFGREIREIAVEPVFSDGLLLDKGHLIAVTWAPAEMLAFIKLDDKAERGRVVERRSDPTLRGPSTVARARNFYLVVNADFATGTRPFSVTGLPRNDDEDENW